MSLWTAHKILVGSTVACFLAYALWEFQGFRASGEAWALARALAALAASGGFALYLSRVAHRR